MARSNRTLTQFAVEKLHQFSESDRQETFIEKKGNTTCSVKFSPVKEEFVFRVCLFDKLIFEASERCVSVFSGDFYDSKGRPSRTTRERLNGLLDAVGELGWTPKGVRAFLFDDGEESTCCIGKGEVCGVLDSKHPDRIIARNPEQLLVF